MKKIWVSIFIITMLIVSSVINVSSTVQALGEGQGSTIVGEENSETNIEGGEQSAISDLAIENSEKIGEKSTASDECEPDECEPIEKEEEQDEAAVTDDEAPKPETAENIEKKDELAEEKEEAEKTKLFAKTVHNTIYLDGKSGNDANDGFTAETAVKSFAKAREIANEDKAIGTIYVVGTVSIEGEVSLDGTNAKIYREPNFKNSLFKVDSGKEAILKDITIDGNYEKAALSEKSLIEVNGKLNISKNAVLKKNHIATREDRSTRGGAVRVKSGTLNMDAGLIQDNTATFGGGVSVSDGGIFNFSGGVIEENKALSGDISKVTNNAASGGGICVDDVGTLNMSGTALVKDNFSEETGGGVAIGSQGVTLHGDNILEMEGGTIDSNVSNSCGGGIFIQAGYQNHRNKAKISAGKIINNSMQGTGKMNHAFGGGGIYVNGFSPGHDFYNADLYLTNVIITNNTAEYQGGGYASCPVSKTKIYVYDGGAIYSNSTGSKKAPDLYILASNDYGGHSGNPPYEISHRMLGGKLYDWRDDEGKVFPISKLNGTLDAGKEESVGLTAGQTDNDDIYSLGKVIISGNKSATRGGGIGSNGNVTIGVKEPVKKNIKVVKSWDKKLTPEAVTVELRAKIGKKDWLIESATLNKDNKFEYTFKDLPAVVDGHNMEDIAYIKEVDSDKYDAEISDIEKQEDGSYVINIENKPVETIEISGKKTWDDYDNRDGKRPDKITVRLLANGVEKEAKEVSEADGWKWTFDHLPKYKKGEAIQYTIKEDAVGGYTSKVNGYDVTNSYKPGKIGVQVNKVWEDGDNQDGKRPESVKVILLADGVETGKSVNLAETNNWTHTFTDLDEFKAGRKIKYTVKEVGAADGYSSVIKGDAETGFTLINKRSPETTKVEGKKTWSDKNNKYGKRPDKITIRVLANGVEKEVKEVSEADGWKWTFDNLPKYEKGKTIQYTIKEDAVEGYTSKVNGYDVTNTYKPGKPIPHKPDTGETEQIYWWSSLLLLSLVLLLLNIRLRLKSK